MDTRKEISSSYLDSLFSLPNLIPSYHAPKPSDFSIFNFYTSIFSHLRFPHLCIFTFLHFPIFSFSDFRILDFCTAAFRIFEFKYLRTSIPPCLYKSVFPQLKIFTFPCVHISIFHCSLIPYLMPQKYGGKWYTECIENPGLKLVVHGADIIHLLQPPILTWKHVKHDKVAICCSSTTFSDAPGDALLTPSPRSLC